MYIFTYLPYMCKYQFIPYAPAVGSSKAYTFAQNNYENIDLTIPIAYLWPEQYVETLP